MLLEAKSGHPGGSLSAIDLLTALWFHEMRGVESADRLAADRDRFVLSKGHGVPALYAILAKKGFIASRGAEDSAQDRQPASGPPRSRADADRRSLDRLTRPGTVGRAGHGARAQARWQERRASTA